ncbi:Lcl domain-containing protein [Methylophilus aquaticus]|uniref:DUF1566 domain-containing protein n=1 Tax=Methylophilus aquaticus TaxID=1971610 RepID=A0ABT9JTV5_9PROT|nr:DUF1566 domain-containing protein [Methylophilus aquaticus]MDP8567581.1 DUF1566 domain-containing protein [Methylophilus aquaticus]
MIKLNQAAIKSSLAAATLALSAFSLNAQAALTSYTSGGQDVVYSSVSDVTWTKDANLLGSMIAADSGVISKIVAASTNNYGISGYTVSASDFSAILGQTTWYGANAFISYLNSINYAGSNQWRLPGVVNTSIGTNTATNGTTAGDELVELFYSELSGTANSAIPNTTTFDNEQAWAYWSGTEYAPIPNYAWNFYNNIGLPDGRKKNSWYYAWAVTSGQIVSSSTPSAVPIPAAAWLFGSGLAGLAGLRRRKQQA